jgi:hypothetical protein
LLASLSIRLSKRKRQLEIDYSRIVQHVAAFELAKLAPDIDPYLKHVRTYIDRIDHMRKLFEAGRDKHTVRQCIINMHTPFEEWQKRAQQPASGSSSGLSPVANSETPVQQP